MKCIDQKHGKDWSLYNGDCIELIDGIPDDSVGLTVHSPPFANLYIYSDSERDMGNCATMEEFLAHYHFLAEKLLRVTIPGRLVVIHCKDLPRYANRDGMPGLIDFPAYCREVFEKCGWSYHSRITIWKCPVTERERTNNIGLLHKTITRDRSQVRQGMADYLIVLRKPPLSEDGLMSAEPVVRDTVDGEGLTRYIGNSDPRTEPFHPSKYARKSNDGMMHSVRIWQRYADPVWWDIDQMDVLNYKRARGKNDERHICPLQLDLIARCIQLWSNPGDVVLDPFAGVGSVPSVAVREGRKGVGFELKPEYFQQAIKNMNAAEVTCAQKQLAFAD